MKQLFALLATCLLVATSSLAHGDDTHEHGLLIEGAWAPHTGKRTMSAAVYLTIKNDGENDATLTGVSTDAANTSMIHESKMVDGVMVMEHVEELHIPAGDSVAFEPGALHIMLMSLTEPLKRGSVMELTLHFEEAGDVPVVVEITGIGGPE